MHTSHTSPATHAGPGIDQTTRMYAGFGGQGSRTGAPGEELAMERSMRRARILTLHFAIVNVEISLRPRGTNPVGDRLVKAAARNAMRATLRREREATLRLALGC